jgi:fused signal recognition particle receptor
MSAWLERLRSGLQKTRQGIADRIGGALRGRQAIDEELYADLEEALLGADMGVPVAERLIEGLRRRVREQRAAPGDLPVLLRAELAQVLAPVAGRLELAAPGPTVVLFVGVNGVGKTTTVAKVARLLQADGRRVLLAAADTFRAAAVEQLSVWADRLGVDLVHHGAGADPGAVVFDAIAAGRARGADAVLCDTAGRLHTKANLMEELRKVARVAGRALPGAPHATLLVLDATTGQNALQQARVFAEAVPLTGLVVTKLDGTARGGVVLAVAEALRLPVVYVGVGEGADDLRPFDPVAYADALVPAGE